MQISIYALSCNDGLSGGFILNLQFWFDIFCELTASELLGFFRLFVRITEDEPH